MHENLDRLRRQRLAKLLKRRHDSLLKSVPKRRLLREPLRPWAIRPQNREERNALHGQIVPGKNNE